MTDSTTTTASQPKEGTIFIPDVIPIFPLPKTVMLPGEVLPLHIFEPRYRTMLHDALSSNRIIGIVELDAAAGEPASDEPPPVHPVGCVGMVGQHHQLKDGRSLIWLVGLERLVIRQELETSKPYRMARVSYLPTPDTALEKARIEPLRRELQQVLPELFDADEKSRHDLVTELAAVTDNQLIALAAQILELPARRKRDLLETESILDLYTMVFEDLYAHMGSHAELMNLDPAVLN
jgi:Lon protease-like protein